MVFFDQMFLLHFLQIRVFTYVVGPKQYSVEEMQEMACNHKGMILAKVFLFFLFFFFSCFYFFFFSWRGTLLT